MTEAMGANVYSPARYDERVFHLALGIEPTDALSGLRAPSSVDVRLERFPSPVDDWRSWRRGETLSAVLPAMPRHRSGRFAVLHPQRSGIIELRLVDNLRAGAGGRVDGARSGIGQGRRIVPRRLLFAIPTEAAVLDAEGDPAVAPIPIWQRAFDPACFPGASASLVPAATAIRGRVERDDGTGRMLPVRWARVRATNAGGDEVGWAHGDDRGEFVLVIERSENDIVAPSDPMSIDLTIGYVDPPDQPDPADPTRADVDPLWDLPIETVTAAPDPSTEPSITGRRFLPEHTIVAPLSPALPVDLRHGRQTSVVFVVP